MLRPDYNNSIVNLVTSLAGKQAPADDLYPPLRQLADHRLSERPVVLLVLDGLGYEYLSHQPESCLYRYLNSRLTSVFPTTTATAVTALALGVPAQQHSISGWFTYLRELGCVASPLPFVPRGGGSNFNRFGIKAEDILDMSALLPALERPSVVVNPYYISDSPYSKALFGDIARKPHQSLEDFFTQLQAALLTPGNPLVWGYWTEFDGMAHYYGIGSAEVKAHFAAIDRAFEEFLQQLAGSDTLVLVTADHGLIDTAPERIIHISEHRPLADSLRLPLCGEPRAAFCYLRPGSERDFDQYVELQLADRCQLFDSEALLAEGLFGRGQPGRRFRERIGDRLLIPRDNWIVNDRLLQEPPFDQVGVHGGLSKEELYVPLIVAEP